MSYRIELTTQEERDLLAMADRGYDCGLWNALCLVGANADGSVGVYGLAEHRAWECLEQFNEAIEGGNDPFGPFVAETLRPKLEALFAEVV